MDTAEVTDLVSELDSSIDDLESSLSPLLKTSLATTSSSIPLLDKAKLYTLATYALESTLYSYLRLNGVDAKEHAISSELTRLKEYFAKIKVAEFGPVKAPMSLDKDAAARFIRHDLAANRRLDQKKEQGQSYEAMLKRKAQEVEDLSRWGTNNRFAGAAKRMRADEADVVVVKANEKEEDDAVDDNGTDSTARDLKAEKKAAKAQRRAEAAQAREGADGHNDNESTSATAKKGEPRSHHDTFQALLQGPLPQNNRDNGKKKKSKRKSRGEVRQELEDKRAREMM